MRADQSWTLSLLLLSSLKAGLIQELNPELNQPGGPEADVLYPCLWDGPWSVVSAASLRSARGAIGVADMMQGCHDSLGPPQKSAALYHELDSPFCPAGSPVALRRGLRHSTMAAAARGLVGIHQSGGPKARSGGTRGTSLR